MSKKKGPSAHLELMKSMGMDIEGITALDEDDEPMDMEDCTKSILQSNDDDLEVAFNDDDLNDPELLKQLGELHREDGDMSHDLAMDDSVPDDSLLIDLQGPENAYKGPQEPYPTPDVLPSAPTNVSVDKLKDEVLQMKRKAAQLNQSGKKPEALDMLKRAKAVENQIISLEKRSTQKIDPSQLASLQKEVMHQTVSTSRRSNSSSMIVTPEDSNLIGEISGTLPLKQRTPTQTIAVVQPTIVNTQPAPQQQTQPQPQVQPQRPVVVAAPTQQQQQQRPKSIEVNPEHEADPRKRIVLLKQKAVALQQAGDKAGALVTLREAKVLEQMIAENPDAMIPKPSAQQEVINMTSAQKAKIYEVLDSEFNKQIKAIAARAEKAREMGDKLKLQEALTEKAKAEKTLQQIMTYKSCSDVVIPIFHWARQKRRSELSFPYLTDTELEVQPPPGQSSLSPFIVLEFGYPTEKPQKAMTQTVAQIPTDDKSVKYDFKFTCKFAIERKKGFALYLKRGKLKFEVFHHRFILSDISAGKGEVSLADLATKSEVYEFADVCQKPRLPSGGKVEIRMRMRTPLEGKDIREEIEDYIVFDNFVSASAPSQATTLLPTPPTTPVAPLPAPATKQVPVVKPTPQTSTTKSAPLAPVQAQPVRQPQPQVQQRPVSVPATKPTQQPVPPTASDEPETFLNLAEIEEDPYGIDHMVSNNVLEMVISQLQEQLVRTKSESVADQLQNAQFKMQMLEVQVGSGKLTPQMYFANLRKAIVEDKKIATELVRLGKREWAKLALSRAKIMQKELEEGEAALAAGDLEE